MKRSVIVALALAPMFVSSMSLAQDLPKWEDVSKEFEKL